MQYNIISPESFNKNISNLFFDCRITFENSQNTREKVKRGFVLKKTKIWYDEFN